MRSRSVSGGWQLCDLQSNAPPRGRFAMGGEAPGPPHGFRWEGERSVSHYSHVGETVAHIPIGDLYLSTGALYYYSSWYAEDGESQCLTVVSLGSIYRVRISRNPQKATIDLEGESLAFSFVVKVHTKHLQDLRLCFNDELSAQTLVAQLEALCFQSQSRCFAFANSKDQFQCQSIEGSSAFTSGWNQFSFEREFTRLNLDSSQWRITRANADFSVCESYPPHFIVPAAISDSVVSRASEFRSSKRVIALSWRHPRGGCICRCSQPRVGFLGLRSSADELMIGAVVQNTPGGFHIFDCRSRIVALANSAKGGGTERVNHYGCCQVTFLGIDNIHAMRESLWSLYRRANAAFAQSWLEHLQLIIMSARDIARQVEEQRSAVLVHCSDGWDRTPQLCSLAQLLLDPYYRTFLGFQSLIDKEWLSFGHKFADRCGHGQGEFWKNSECSPVFLQFLDVVYQLTVTFRGEFEFNEHFLLTLADQVYAMHFGTFLYDNYQQRKQSQVRFLTPSFWCYVNHPAHRGSFLNPLYRPVAEKHLYQLCDSIRPRLWANYFYRWKGAEAIDDPDSFIRQFVESQFEQPSMPTFLSRTRHRLSKLIPDAPPSISPKIRDASVLLDQQDQNSGKAPLNLTLCIIDDYVPDPSR